MKVVGNVGVNRNFKEEINSIFNINSCGFVICNSKCEIKEINSFLLNKLNYSSEPKGASLFQLIDEKSVDDFKDYIQVAKVSGKSNVFYTTLSQPLKSGIPCTAEIMKISSKTSYYFMIKFEILPAQSKNDRLTELDTLFYSISQNLNEGIFRYSPEKGFVYINNSFAKLFEYPVFDLIGADLSTIIDREESRKYLARLFNAQNHIRSEVLELHKSNNEVFHGLLNCTKVTDIYGEVYFDGAIIDVSEKIDADKMLHQKNIELQKINTQMDRFLYSASHDIRAPLTSVMGLVNILRMDMTDETHLDYLHKIEQSVFKLDSFVKDVKDFTQNARQRIRSERIDFDALVDLVWKKFRYVHQQIIFKPEINNGRVFFSDCDRIKLILENLIKNSIAFRDPKKEEPFIKIKVHLLSDKAIIEVIDNGLGISKPHLSKIFNMFYRASEKSQGSGLGLYIVNETLLKLKGNVKVESEVGLGTIFTLEIPNDEKGKLISRKHELARGRFEL